MTNEADELHGKSEVDDAAFEALRMQVERLSAEVARRDAITRAAAQAEIDARIAEFINPILGELAMRERADGNFTSH